MSDVFGEDPHYKDGNWYFDEDEDRVAMVTKYAFVSRKAMSTCLSNAFLKNNCPAWWWLRSRGTSPNYAADVHVSGYVNSDGHDVHYVRIGGRPALWVQY